MNHVFESGKAVVIKLSREAPPQLYAISDVPEAEIQVDGQIMTDAGLGDWLGFYDWLRAKPGRVIGVRLWPDEENPHTVSIGHCKGVEIAHGAKELSIYFVADRNFEPHLSGDQDFGNNRLFVGTSGYAITFNCPTPR